MINESEFYTMLPKEYCVDTIFVHQCFMSLFNGMLNWVGDVLYPRFNYKVITTYDKAIEVFKKKMENKDGQTQAPFLPALTLDPMLDFSNEERAGRFLWMFKNLDSSSKMWNTIKLTDQGVTVTPMFTRYQGTVELTAWMPSIYELIDFRTILIQYCGGYQRWIRPELFNTHLILPKCLMEMPTPDGSKINWDGINPELITLKTTATEEYALPFKLDAIWRLDSFGDNTNKMGGDQVAEYKCTANFTWECNIPTFIKVNNYRYPINSINMSVGLTPTEAKYPRVMSYPMYTKLDLYKELVPFSKQMPIYNIADENAIPLIRIPDNLCSNYPEVYKPWNHYVTGNVYDIDKLTDPNEITDINSILVIEQYKDEYIPYIRKCRGLVTKNDKDDSYALFNLVKNYNISMLYDIRDSKLYNSIKSLHGKLVTFDALGKYIYKNKVKVECYDCNSDFSKFIFNNNIIRIINKFALERRLKDSGSYKMPFSTSGITSKIDERKHVLCEQFSGEDGVHKYELKSIINSNCCNNMVVHINGNKIDMYSEYNNIKVTNYLINGYYITFNETLNIKTGDIISIYRPNDCIYTYVTLICDYKISKEDEYNYLVNKQKLTVDISKCRKVDMSTIQCVSYNGLMNQTIDFIIDEDKKTIVFNIEPHRDRYIQIYGTLD